MSRFLLIHTSLDQGFAAVSDGRALLAVRTNSEARQHGKFLHQAVQEMMVSVGLDFSQLSAIGVTHGPGSYTGIRVGLAAAKGFGYALQIPLVVVSNLKALAATAVAEVTGDFAFVSLIHARQSEYYCGVYDANLVAIKKDSVVQIDSLDLEEITAKKPVIFGVGLPDAFVSAAQFLSVNSVSPEALVQLVSDAYERGQISSALQAAPLYLKSAFVTTPRK